MPLDVEHQDAIDHALTHHTAQSLNPLVGRNEHHTRPPLSRLLHDYHQERAKLGQIGILIHMHQHTDDTDLATRQRSRIDIGNIPQLIHGLAHPFFGGFGNGPATAHHIRHRGLRHPGALCHIPCSNHPYTSSLAARHRRSGMKHSPSSILKCINICIPTDAIPHIHDDESYR